MIRRVSGCHGRGARPAAAARVECLESRRFLDATAPFNESFIFGPANAPGASGYLPDHGAVFGDRGNGLEYGWNVNEAAGASPRHPTIADEYDGSIAFSPGQFWQVAVPDGAYHVTIALGDPLTTSGLHVVDVEGTYESLVSTRKHRGQLWTMDVTVSDGLLTVSAPVGVRHFKRDEIASLTISQDPPAVLANGLAAPSGLTPISQTQTTVRLQWAAPAQGAVTGYDIYRGSVVCGTVGAATTTFTDTGLAPGTSCMYTVTALGTGGGESLPSNVVTTATLPSSSSPAPPSVAGPWHLAFDDEFNSLNSNVWTNGDYWWDGNGGDQTAFEPDNVSTSNGILSLTADRQRALDSDGEIKPYSSGLLQSGGIQGISNPGFSFTYGYIETRAMFAPGKGLASTLWMLPVSHQDNHELDLLEYLGKSPNVLGGDDRVLPYADDAFSYHSASNLSKTWHTYGIDWEPNQITWYIDGKQIATFTDPSVIPQQAMYLIMNLIAGGKYAGAVNSHTPDHSAWNIDYVRVWQH